MTDKTESKTDTVNRERAAELVETLREAKIDVRVETLGGDAFERGRRRWQVRVNDAPPIALASWKNVATYLEGVAAGAQLTV